MPLQPVPVPLASSCEGRRTSVIVHFSGVFSLFLIVSSNPPSPIPLTCSSLRDDREIVVSYVQELLRFWSNLPPSNCGIVLRGTFCFFFNFQQPVPPASSS